MRKRRVPDLPLHLRALSAGGALAGLVWSGAARRPIDALAVAALSVVSLVIIVNAVYLQSGSHPAPFFANTKPAPIVVNDPPKPVVTQISTRPVAAPAITPSSTPVAARRNDPIADLIGPSPRIEMVQRALSEYGYGQVKPSGVLDDATSAAISKFEREHKLPVTGRVSDRLVSELATLIGHPLD